MALWFVRGARRGVVTTRYPSSTDEWAARIPTPPSFDPRRLTPLVVDELVELCPSSALHREGEELIMDIGRCTACGRCESYRDGIARPSGIFELAATSRSQLIKRIPIEGRQ